MVARVVIPARFNGPPRSGNGGYSCGTLGMLVGDSAEVTLRKPPPLDRPMVVEVEGEGDARQWKMLDGEAVVATARAAEPDVQCPDPPTLARARAAEFEYVGFDWHLFPTCFVCGPERAEGDGLRLFTGKVEGQPVVASVWTPTANLAAADGAVDRNIVWSALDCPTYFGGRLNDYAKLAVLGRLTAKLLAPVQVGVRHVVVGWPIGQNGRKWEGGAALFTEQGMLCAYSRGLWVALKE
jgi:hypothetical protein